MTLKMDLRMKKLRFVAIVASSLPPMAQAASVVNPIVGCKGEADSKKVLEFIAENNTAGLEKFKTSKITTGDCSSLLKGMSVAIDKKDGQLLCVRPIGGLDCFWTTAVAINQNSTDTEKAPSSQPQGRGRGHGRTPQSE